MELKVGMRIRVGNPKSKHYGKIGYIVTIYTVKEKYSRILVRFRNQTTDTLTTTGIIILESV
ncbi:MAG: hypothetical protein ACRC6V_13535 [Bacteroidales bacterium]